MYGIRDMDYSILAQRMGNQIRQKRLHRGLTQAQLASISGLPRQKVIAVEQGSLSTSMAAYARVLGALDCDLTVTPAAMPTLDEVGALFE